MNCVLTNEFSPVSYFETSLGRPRLVGEQSCIKAYVGGGRGADYIVMHSGRLFVRRRLSVSLAEHYLV